MSEAAAALLGAIIGGLSAVLGSYLAALRQTKLERERWERAHEDLLRDETRVALAELTRTLAAMSHNIMWATSRTLRNSEATAEVIRLYEAELHSGVADAVKAQMHVAALSHALYDRITPYVSELIHLGGDSFDALLAAATDYDKHKRDLLTCNERALAFIRRLPAEVGEMLRL